jgi:hypothetical protein
MGPSEASLVAAAASAAASTAATPGAVVGLFTDATPPWRSNAARSSSSVAENGRFPTYSFLLNSHSFRRALGFDLGATDAGLRTGLSGRGRPAAMDTARDAGCLAGESGRERRTR